MKHLCLIVFCLSAGAVLRAETKMITNIYTVPAWFAESGTKPVGFSRRPSNKNSNPTERRTAKAILENVGVTFSEGATALYEAESSSLMVRNTKDQIELVEAYLDAIGSHIRRQIYVTVREVTYIGDLTALPATITVTTPGTPPEIMDINLDLLRFPDSKRESQGRGYDDFDSFRSELTRPPRWVAEILQGRRIEQTAVLTDPQFQVMIRHLAQIREVDLASFPSVMVRSGQPGLSQLKASRCGFVAAIQPGNTTIALDLFIPPIGEAIVAADTSFSATVSTSIKDGQIVVIAEKNPDGKNRLLFVQAQLMDPEGIPIP